MFRQRLLTAPDVTHLMLLLSRTGRAYAAPPAAMFAVVIERSHSRENLIYQPTDGLRTGGSISCK